MGRGWDALGRLFEALGHFLVVFGTFKIHFFSAWIQNKLHDGFWVDLGSSLEGFGKDLEEIWEAFGSVGRNFRAFWMILCYYGLFWVVGVFWPELRKIFADALRCLLRLSCTLGSTSVLAFARRCLLGPCVCTVQRETEL